MRSKKRSLLAVGVGGASTALGTLLLFLPGPGIPLIVFGVSLLASQRRSSAKAT